MQSSASVYPTTGIPWPFASNVDIYPNTESGVPGQRKYDSSAKITNSGTPALLPLTIRCIFVPTDLLNIKTNNMQGKFINTQIRIICMANRVQRRKRPGGSHSVPARNFIRSSLRLPEQRPPQDRQLGEFLPVAS
jgi:hypothetical protein